MTATSRTSNAEFEIDDWNEVAYDEPGEGPKLTRITIKRPTAASSTGPALPRCSPHRAPPAPAMSRRSE